MWARKSWKKWSSPNSQQGSNQGEFNADDHYIYYCGQESLRRNGVAIMVNITV